MNSSFRFSNGGSVRLDTTKLEKLQKQLQKRYSVKVGILGAKAAREKGGPISNAEIAAIHEFGSPSKNIPPRSWLRMPLMTRLPEIFRRYGQRLINRMTVDNILDIYDELGARAMKVIDEAFSTSGFGSWAPKKVPTHPKKKKGRLKLSKYKQLTDEQKKQYSRPLIDTGELRKHVDREVIER